MIMSAGNMDGGNRALTTAYKKILDGSDSVWRLDETGHRYELIGGVWKDYLWTSAV
jgi:hypothetical protein